MGTRNPGHQTSKGLEARELFSPGFLSPVEKKIPFITEAETVTAGTKFVIRDTEQEGENTEKRSA